MMSLSKGSFKLERISLILLMSCNLKCKNCCVQAPYYEKKYYPGLEFVKLEVDRLFEICDTINYFSLEGGEALLRNDLAEILRHIARYKDQIGVEVPIITNGTIVPSEAVLNSAKLFNEKIRFIVDDYGPISSNIQAIVSALKEYGIRYDVRNYNDNAYCGGWVDLYGDYEQKRDDVGAKELFSRCAWAQKLKGVIEIIGGLIYFCPVSRIFYERGLAMADDEIIDFISDDSIDSIRDKIRALFAKDTLSACKYCNGIHDKSVRYKPAIQLTSQEMKESYLSKHLYREEI